MKKLIPVIGCILTFSAFAQSPPERFHFPSAGASERLPDKAQLDNSSPPLSHPQNDLDDSGIDRRTSIEAAFFRRLHSALVRNRSGPGARFLETLRPSSHELKVLEDITSTWRSSTKNFARERMRYTCEALQSYGAEVADAEKAENALKVYEDLRLSEESRQAEITWMINQVEARLGSETTDKIVTELERQVTMSQSFGRLSWPDGVRIRGNVVAEVVNACEGVK